MQRWGGGSYTRKRKGKGGGNDPRCGCDMRVGWETSFGNRVQQGGGCGCGAGLLMNGGGSCGSGVIMERTLQGGSRKGRRGLLFSNGGGYDYSKDMIIDYFPKMKMTDLVYTGKGGKRQDIGRTLANTRADVSSISNYAAMQKGGKRQDIGRTLGNMRADVSSISNYASQPRAAQTGGTCPVPDACPFPGTGYCEFYAKGGANYGEPMSLQAQLRGGYNSEEWRKKFLEAVDIIVQMLKDYPSPTSGENIDHAQEQLLRELYNRESPKFNKIFPMIGMPPSTTNEMRENESLYDIRNQYANKVQELLERLREYNVEIELNDGSSRGSISPPTWSDNEGQIGGGMNGCGCLTNPFIRGYTGSSLTGGKYKITRKNRNALKRHKAGKSIGFTMRSHLKAIGLLPRTSKKNYGKKIVSNKYK